MDLSASRLQALTDSGKAYEYVLFSQLGHNNMTETLPTATEWVLRLTKPRPPSESNQVETHDPAATAALKIVNQRMDAYNEHDIDGFMALYADEFEVFTYPDRSLGKGKQHLRSLFEPMFQEGIARVKVHGQFTKDSFVVNHETVDYGTTTTDYMSIYEVRDGLIQSVRFVRD